MGEVKSCRGGDSVGLLWAMGSGQGLFRLIQSESTTELEKGRRRSDEVGKYVRRCAGVVGTQGYGRYRDQQEYLDGLRFPNKNPIANLARWTWDRCKRNGTWSMRLVRGGWASRSNAFLEWHNSALVREIDGKRMDRSSARPPTSSDPRPSS